jgi:AcrR family transcriptional regulator
MGLRERKKEQTRQLIADTARRLFAEQGFDRVTVAEIARAAEVAEATVFNYFRTKEDLVYSGFEAFSDGLVDAVRTRAPGEPVLAAVRHYLLDAPGTLDRIEEGESGALEKARSVLRTIEASPRLRAREQQAFTEITGALAAQVALETGAKADDPLAQAAAHALVGVHRTLVAYARQRVLAADGHQRIATDVRERGAQAFALLERGLRGYGVKPSGQRR